ncbi:class 1 isoprenoid biosynthesis enzyme [Chitinophaga sp. GCM10012297]|uniref:Class 1 isoprenoid biosynthesis enzyme n=1 Tax=Chitinophaga chungangae TaxID=2821488 RepID=A0ABS3YDW3_9BACT|nr:class 1 isoprenoid biosynthesis enzyme [Chitinophaga chungangae]MBO9152876.1 class 1 isoprenoid biosynthesis enzyme [Chitinophaga chungangae]
MPNTPVTLLKTAAHLYKLRRQLRKQNSYFRQHLPPLLASLEAGQTDAFDPSSVKRFNKYWQLALNLVCNSFYDLMGKQLSRQEHQRILMMSVFGPLYDDLFDDNILSHEKIEAFTLHPENHEPASFKEHALQKIYLLLLSQAPDRQKLLQHMHLVFVWQKASLKQLHRGIEEEELYQITYRKSYHSILLFHSILDHYPSEAVFEMLFPMAGLLQLTNDAFDVYKDIQSGIYTIPNLYLDYDRIQQKFLRDVAEFNRTLARLPFIPEAKGNYKITIHALHAMGWMALEQLKENTRHAGNHEALSLLSRKQLVCDMDNFPQKLRWIKQVKELSNHQ